VDTAQILKIQQELARCTLENPAQRHKRLYRLVCEGGYVWLRRGVCHKGSHTPGLNGITKQHVDGRQRGRERCGAACEELLTGEYRPQPVKRIYIPKANGKLRPLGIATSKTEWYKLLSKWFWSLSTKVSFIHSRDFDHCDLLITPSVHYAEDLQTPMGFKWIGRYCVF